MMPIKTELADLGFEPHASLASSSYGKNSPDV